MRVFTPCTTHESNRDFNGQSHKPNENFYTYATHKSNKDFFRQSHKTNESFYVRRNSRIKRRFSGTNSRIKRMLSLAKLTTNHNFVQKIFHKRKIIFNKLQYHPYTRIHNKNLTNISHF